MKFKKSIILLILIIILNNISSRGEASMGKKVLIIGLDGATFDIILPLVKEGKLPNFEKMIKEGVYGNLTSTLPTISPVA